VPDVWRPDLGQFNSTLYQPTPRDGFPPGIYVFGSENEDTDEYDAHVIAHEFQHYFESALSRSDATGGDHALGEKLDMRLAFSEGFANAFSAMVLNDPQYRDSYGSRQGNSFNFNIETENEAPAGWFNEGSIFGLVWDLYDGAADQSDAVQLGYGPMFAVMTNELRTGQALTSIFPFITALKAQAGAPISAIDTLVASRAIRSTDIDAFGSTETNSGDIAASLPVYTDLTLNGPVVQVCGTASTGTYNKLGNRRFVKFSVPGTRSITITVTGIGTGQPLPDPDLLLYKEGFFDYSNAEAPYTEQATFQNVPAGGYVLEVYEYSHIDPAYTIYGARGPTCMNVTVTG